MKNLLLLLMVMCLALEVFTQTYTPFPTGNTQWITKRYNAGNGGTPSTNYHVYTMQGDTLINDTTYHKVYFQYPQSPQYMPLSAGIREQDQRVYIRPLGSADGFNSCVDDFVPEYLIYDFTIDEVGDSLYLPTSDEMSLFVAQEIDSILVNGTYRTRWTFMPYEDMCSPFWYTYIEGIGSVNHPFGQGIWMTQEISHTLSCMTIDGVFEYSFYPVPPLCDIADFVGVEEAKFREPIIYFEGTTLHLDPAFDWHDAQIAVFNVSGQCVANWKPLQVEKDLSELSSGMYFVQVRLSNGTAICKKVLRE
jgi:hypothetical protein